MFKIGDVVTLKSNIIPRFVVSNIIGDSMIEVTWVALMNWEMKTAEIHPDMVKLWEDTNATTVAKTS